MSVSTPDCDSLREKTGTGNVPGVSAHRAVRTEAQAFPNPRVFLWSKERTSCRENQHSNGDKRHIIIKDYDGGETKDISHANQSK